MLSSCVVRAPGLGFLRVGQELVVLGGIGLRPGVGRERKRSGAFQGPVHRGPADTEQGGDLGDVVVAAVVHAADLAPAGRCHCRSGLAAGGIVPGQAPRWATCGAGA